jgi:alkylation response protein AidB-like acyl-CoA dehydrogenase
MRRELFTVAHEDFRALVRTFLEREVLPRYPDWERAGTVDRDVWRAAGKQGLLGMDMPVEHGGGGADDYRFHVVLAEEFAAAGVHAPALSLHNEVVGPYLKALATPEQRARWLPGFCSGELITAIAITEPGAGSDLTRLRTTARPDGDRPRPPGPRYGLPAASPQAGTAVDRGVGTRRSGTRVRRHRGLLPGP